MTWVKISQNFVAFSEYINFIYYFEKGSYYKKSTLARAVSRVSHDLESQFECLPVCCLPTDCMAVKINGRTNYCHFYDHRRSLLDSHMTLENYAKV